MATYRYGWAEGSTDICFVMRGKLQSIGTEGKMASAEAWDFGSDACLTITLLVRLVHCVDVVGQQHSLSRYGVLQQQADYAYVSTACYCADSSQAVAEDGWACHVDGDGLRNKCADKAVTCIWKVSFV